ncbi:MAG TPA: hypothetical protein VGU90_13430 [Terriglobales bacterium]|nr:hypothetical protein [Terriglobales bacterium]
MAYVEPATVWSPKARIRSVQVIFVHDAGQGESWSVARVNFDGEDRVGIRWNGEEGEPGMGNPQSRGKATWFIVPQELEGAVLDRTEELSHGQLLERYTEMANDTEREHEAEEWSEGLIGDASTQR